MPEEDKKKKAPKRVTKQTRPHKPPVKVDVDRQCGVALPGGGVCARSLTCKTHSVGAKRAVAGRSRPFNVLLAEYQQRNQVKQAQRNTVVARHEEEAAEKEEKPLTDKEEVDQVLRGVIMSQPLPLSRAPPMVSTRSRTRFLTLREMLLGSVNKIPPIPSVSNEPAGAGTSLAAVMAATGPVLGRCVVFNPLTGAQTTRPARLRMRMPEPRQ